MDNRKSYAPESIEEEYAFLAGRVAALVGYLESLHRPLADVETVRKIIGIEEESKDGRS